jgi:RNA polymerase sigma-70 factor, ECF subfamily
VKFAVLTLNHYHMNSTASIPDKQQFVSDLVDFREQLYYYALQLTENRDDALDLVQETNYKALKHNTNNKQYEHVRAWLYTILRNTYINHLRSGYKKNTWIGKEDSNLQQVYPVMPESEHPDRIYFRKELNEKISILPDNYSRPLTLHLHGYSYKEIAGKMNVPIGTVKSRIYLAKQKIQKVYGEC